MKAKNQENLKALIKLMKEIPDDQLDMREWTCGTAACIGGWIGWMPEFKQSGGKRDVQGVPVYFNKNGGFESAGSQAVARFLGIDSRVAADLCLRDGEDWPINPNILFSEVKPSDVVEVLEQWLE